MSDSRWYTPEARELFRAVLTLETVDECARFLRDLLTEDELAECSARYRAVQLLDRRLSYREVSKLTGLSTATVTRVAKWWQRGMGGYRLVLERTKRRTRGKAGPDEGTLSTGLREHLEVLIAPGAGSTVASGSAHDSGEEESPESAALSESSSSTLSAPLSDPSTTEGRLSRRQRPSPLS